MAGFLRLFAASRKGGRAEGRTPNVLVPLSHVPTEEGNTRMRQKESGRQTADPTAQSPNRRRNARTRAALAAASLSFLIAVRSLLATDPRRRTRLDRSDCAVRIGHLRRAGRFRPGLCAAFGQKAHLRTLWPNKTRAGGRLCDAFCRQRRFRPPRLAVETELIFRQRKASAQKKSTAAEAIPRRSFAESAKGGRSRFNKPYQLRLPAFRSIRSVRQTRPSAPLNMPRSRADRPRFDRTRYALPP